MQRPSFLAGRTTRLRGTSGGTASALARQQITGTSPSTPGVLETAQSQPLDSSKNIKKMCFFKDYTET